MSPEEPVTIRLVEEMVGRSHENLAGEIKVLAEAQRGAAEAQKLATQLASREHEQVRGDLAQLRETLLSLSGKVLNISTDDQVADAVARWKRRAIGAAVTAVGILIAAAGVIATITHP